MKAVTIIDNSLEIREHSDPKPGTGEILVEVRSAGINGADILQVRGRYPAPPGSPEDIPGMELAGVVVANGDKATRFRAGDRVMSIVGGGAQAQLATVHERQVMPVPDGMSWTEAGGLPETFCTAYDALFLQAGLATGDRLLVSGAAGGVGTSAVQLAVVAGATVTASVRNEAQRHGVSALGATAVGSEDAWNEGPFDVVLELVGAPNMEANLSALRTGGRIVVIGVGAGAKAELDFRALMSKRARILGSTLRARPLEQKAELAREVERHVLPLFESRRISVPIHRTYPLESAKEAYEQFSAGGKLGKIVLLSDR